MHNKISLLETIADNFEKRKSFMNTDIESKTIKIGISPLYNGNANVRVQHR